MSDPVTPVQQEALNFLRSYIAGYHRPPSYDEIRIGLGLKSKGNVSRLIGQLERRGLVRRNIGLNRSLEIVEADGGESIVLSKHVVALLKQRAHQNGSSVNAVAEALLRDLLEAA